MIANRRRWGTISPQEFQSLAGRIGVQGRYACDVPARSGEARDKAAAHGVCRQGEDDRDNRSRLLRRDDRRGPPRNNDIDLETHELGRDLAEPVRAALCPAVFYGDVATLGPPEFA